jgi:hypothetical protein
MSSTQIIEENLNRPKGMLFFTFGPSCPPVFLADQQKVK